MAILLISTTSICRHDILTKTTLTSKQAEEIACTYNKAKTSNGRKFRIRISNLRKKFETVIPSNEVETMSDTDILSAVESSTTLNNNLQKQIGDISSEIDQRENDWKTFLEQNVKSLKKNSRKDKLKGLGISTLSIIIGHVAANVVGACMLGICETFIVFPAMAAMPISFITFIFGIGKMILPSRNPGEQKHKRKIKLLKKRHHQLTATLSRLRQCHTSSTWTWC